ncbi:MAG TPA: VWA domain-containing protein [Blastocatellia bacterium]|nr:VWA domain-containing protein [Blastocatellia bacterium]
MRRSFADIRSRSRYGLAACLILFSLFAPVAGGMQKSKGQKDDKNQDSFKLSADLVIVNVTVTDGDGRYIRGLRADDFSVAEDGAAQQITSFSADEAPFAASILIDTSGSMEFKFGMVRGAAASFLEHIGDDDQVSVYGFNDKIRQFQDFSNAKDISDYVWDAKAEDSTKLFDCMETASKALAKRPERRRAELVITDGCDNASGGTRDSVIKRALQDAVTIYTVDLIDDDFLRGSGTAAETLRRGRADMMELARQTGGRYVHSPQGDSLEASFDGIVDELRNQYTLGYYSTNARRDGRWRGISVTMNRRAITARARRGYYAPKG